MAFPKSYKHAVVTKRGFYSLFFSHNRSCSFKEKDAYCQKSFCQQLTYRVTSDRFSLQKYCRAFAETCKNTFVVSGRVQTFLQNFQSNFCKQPLPERPHNWIFGIVQKVFSEKASAIARMRQKYVRNASKMRQNGSCFIGKRGTFQNASEMRHNCVPKCVKNAQNIFGGEHLLDDTVIWWFLLDTSPWVIRASLEASLLKLRWERWAGCTAEKVGSVRDGHLADPLSTPSSAP